MSLISKSSNTSGLRHLVILAVAFCVLLPLLTEASGEEHPGRNGGEGRRGRGGRNKEENEIQRPRNRKKGGGSEGGRRRVTASLMQQIVAEALQEQLEPLNTALSLIRLDTYTENIQRQLGTLEHIQSKLLTEYGELRAAINDVARNTIDLAKQVATLDARVVSLDRSLGHHHHRPPVDAPSERSVRPEREDSEDYPQIAVPHHVSQVTQAVREAVTSINGRLQATERRFKEDLATLENRTTEALKKSHGDLDRRMAIAGLDSVLILNTLDKLANKTCPSGGRNAHQRQQQPQQGSRGETSSSRLRAQRTQLEDANAQDELAYFPAEEEDQGSSNGIAGAERVRTWLIREGGRPVTEVQTLNLGMVSRLATEIARQIADDQIVDTDLPRDCAAVAAAGETTSGVYTIYPASCSARFSVQVWCELEDGGPAWTVIQRRGSTTSETPHPVVDFFRDWPEYKWGFGDLEGEYWLGTEYIHQLSQSGDYELKVDLQDWANETRWAKYKHFSLANEEHNYTLALGDYEGTAGNSLKYHQGAPFSTRDRDNDFNPRGHCARTFHGAWWFTACHESHLNGRYHHGRHKSYGDGINWMAFRGHNYSLKFSRMMMRRSNL